MADKIYDGGTAFPMQDAQAIHTYAAAKIIGITHHEERDRLYLAARAQAVGGMSLRDYFAAKAMQAAATNPVGADGFTFDERAAWAYNQADAMLRARKGGAA